MSRAVARTVLTVDFARPARPGPSGAPTGRIPRVARLLALAHHIDVMIATGEIRDWAGAARLCEVTRARMTQVAALLLLAPEIQEEILALPPVTEGREAITERSLRPLTAEVSWNRQLALWKQMRRRKVA